MILDEAQVLLEKGGYRTRLRFEPLKCVYFEDSALMGFVAVFITVKDLLVQWKVVQDSFLRANAPLLRGDRQKAWNVYSVFLTEESISEEAIRELNLLEEDFSATRKIARAGIQGKGQVKLALAPLLPLTLAPETRNAAESLSRKLDQKETDFLRKTLSFKDSPEEVADWLSMLD